VFFSSSFPFRGEPRWRLRPQLAVAGCAIANHSAAGCRGLSSTASCGTPVTFAFDNFPQAEFAAIRWQQKVEVVKSS
jgi:hypothetical protein